MSADPDVGAVAPEVTEPVATGAVEEVEEKSEPEYEPPADLGAFPADDDGDKNPPPPPTAQPAARPEPEYRAPVGPQPDLLGHDHDRSLWSVLLRQRLICNYSQTHPYLSMSYQ